MQIFDIFFIMALCFATLLTSMYLTPPVIVGDGATGMVDYIGAITPHSVIIIVVVLSVYLAYLLTKSNKELKIMVEKVYADKEYPVIPRAARIINISAYSGRVYEPDPAPPIPRTARTININAYPSMETATANLNASSPGGNKGGEDK